MKSFVGALPRLSYALLAAFLIAMAVRSHNDTTLALVICSVLMFAFCWANATHLMGARPALQFVLIAVSFGWFAEQMGSSRGWFFGSYTYTDVLGWRLGDVPMIIPLMWFALCYCAYVISNFIVWQSPVNGSSSLRRALFMSFLAAMIVTAYDLGADPYMVFVLKAWIMAKTDGWWFGETLQGFVGWVTVACAINYCFHLSVRKQGVKVQPGFVKWHALLPFSIFGFSMVFQMLKGYPVETRTIAFFAMGIPLLCAMAGWWRWAPAAGGANVPSPVTDARLEQSQYAADPLADDTIANILGPWPRVAQAVVPADKAIKIAAINRQFALWTTNDSLHHAAAVESALSPEITQALQTYLQKGQALPDWADRAKIARAEVLFMDYGALSCTLLFCSSLPECYVVPDLASVLHVAGQLEQHTEYRIRATAAMIFPVMMHGGLCRPEGSGVAQILKVRLIHATVRNLILRGDPQSAVRALGEDRHVVGAGVVTPGAKVNVNSASMYEALLAHGWKLGEDGLPCNQEELAYTLLTFGYIFLRSMRKLGIGLTSPDEEAYLHAWNVVGHVLGIRRELMADTMAQAEVLFKQMQARGRADPVSPDPRGALGNALMNTMAEAIPWTPLKSFPVLMTRFLCGKTNAQEIGLVERASLLSIVLFTVLMGVIRCIDTAVQWLFPEFSISRFITRVMGYHMMSKILLDQTRPLKLPDHLLNSVNTTMGLWSDDPKASAAVNRLEDSLTQTGSWSGAKRLAKQEFVN